MRRHCGAHITIPSPNAEPGIVATGIAHGQLYWPIMIAIGIALLIRIRSQHPAPIAT